MWELDKGALGGFGPLQTFKGRRGGVGLKRALNQGRGGGGGGGGG